MVFNFKKIAILTASAILAVTACGYSHAIEAPSASLQILRSTPASLNWRPERDISDVADMCIASTTGRFRLYVRTSAMSSRAADGHLKYNLNFTGPQGVTTAVVIDGHGEVSFAGNVNSNTPCQGLANTTLGISIEHSQAVEVTSGAYNSQLEFEIVAE
jgi:hypothetical protein